MSGEKLDNMATTDTLAVLEKTVNPTVDANSATTDDVSKESKEAALADAVSRSESKSGTSEAEKDDKQVKEEKPKPASFKHFIRIFSYADKWDWLLNAIALIAGIGAGSALPLLSIVFGKFVNSFNGFILGTSSPDEFRAYADNFVLYFIYLFVGRFVAQYIATLAVTISAMRTTRAFRQVFVEKTLRQEIWYFDRKTTGSIATQVTTNINRVQTGIAEKLLFAFQALAMFFSAFIVSLTIQWKLTLIVMTIIPAIFIITAFAVGILIKHEAIVTRILSQAATLAEEAIASVRTVHAFWARDKLVGKYDEYLTSAHKESDKENLAMGVLFSNQYFCVYAGIALAFWEGFRLYLQGEIPNAGNVFTVVFSTMIAAQAVTMLAPQLQIITYAAAAAAELFEIIDKPSELDPLDESGLQPKTCAGEIQINNLTFAYPMRPTAPVLQDFTISIPAGKTTALVGPSGCGKSTTVGLLERWYKPNSGSILLDGVDISEYNVSWLRRRMRLVAQEPVLFKGTIYENVRRGLVDDQLDLPAEEQARLIKEACVASFAHDFIESLPEGYETQVGERASMLSGGQKQRIAIARSIVSDPRILLLDEATSALDPHAEGIVQRALNNVSASRTTLIIAHKLATIKHADNIAVMSNGIIVEQGTHSALMAADGRYAALVRAQDLGHASEEMEDEEKVEADLDRAISLVKTRTRPEQVKEAKKGTIGWSLIRCLTVMLAEFKELYGMFALSGFCCILAGATFPAQAILFSKLLTVFILPRDEAADKANFFSLMFFVMALVNLGSYIVIGWICNASGGHILHRYRREMFADVLAQDMEFFDDADNTSGALASRLSTNPSSLQELISGNLMLVFITIVNLISSSALAIAYGWKLGLVVVFGGLPILVACGFFRIRLQSQLEANIESKFAESAGIASEAVTAMRTVSSLTLEREILRRYRELLDGIVTRSVRAVLWTMFWFALSQSLEFLVQALGFWYSSRLLASREYTAEQVYVIFIGVVFAGSAAGQFFSYSTSFTKASAAANYILWLRKLEPIMRETPDNKDQGPSEDGPVALDSVEFTYKQRAASRVLKGISMTINPGQYAAFVGPSGCGKSTLVSLLERFYDPTSGKITFDGTDISTLSPKKYRAHISLVQQEPTLYQGSVRENVNLGMGSETDPSDEQINEALRKANALDFVSSLPDGLATLCGSRGIQLSGGQRQRIAIARAMIRDPRLLLLDEATSALDTQSERVVQKTLDEAAASRTTIAVAHRLSTIRNADVIFVFDNGVIAEVGTHAELQRKRGRYYDMCLAQSLDQA